MIRKMRTHGAWVLLMFGAGCGSGRDAVDRMISDQEAILQEVTNITTPGEKPHAKGDPVNHPMRLPSMEARFCLERAKDDLLKARDNTTWDTALIVAGAVNLTTGSVTQAAAAALPNKSDGTSADGKSALEVLGAATLAGAAGIFALRTALSLSDTARAQRIAAIRNVDAAILIFQHYAIVDDPNEVGKDAFSTCRDGDIDIAGTFPGAKATDAFQKILDSREQAKNEKAKAATASASAVEDASKQEGIAAKAQDSAKSKNIDAIMAVAASEKISNNFAATVQPKIDEAKAAQEQADAEIKRHQELRAQAAVALSAAAPAALNKAKVQGDVVATKIVTAATKTRAAVDAAMVALKTGAPGTAAANNLTKNGAAVDDAGKSAAVETQKLGAADAQTAAAKADQLIKNAKDDVAEKQVALFQAIARWRRAVFFLTAADRRIAESEVLKITDELQLSRNTLYQFEGKTSVEDRAVSPPADPKGGAPSGAPKVAPLPAADPKGGAPPGAPTAPPPPADDPKGGTPPGAPTAPPPSPQNEPDPKRR